MQKKPEWLFYRCPACQASVSISHEFIGKRVDCPNCELPFLPKIPEAMALMGDQMPASADYAVRRPTDDEGLLREIHPAMFRQHPFVFIGLCILAVAIGVVGLMFLGTGGYSVSMPCFILLACILGYFGYWWLEVLSTTLRITSKRTTLRKGIIAKSTTEVQHDDVRNIQIQQGMWQRVLGVGDLAVSSAGQSDLEIRVKGIANPDEVADFIRTMQ